MTIHYNSFFIFQLPSKQAEILYATMINFNFSVTGPAECTNDPYLNNFSVKYPPPPQSSLLFCLLGMDRLNECIDILVFRFSFWLRLFNGAATDWDILQGASSLGVKFRRKILA